jgi:hypothetical protein
VCAGHLGILATQAFACASSARGNARALAGVSTLPSMGRWAGAVAIALVAVLAAIGTASAAPRHRGAAPDLGPNVKVFDPRMPTSEIQSTVDAIARRQISNEFGTQRYALLFEPGTYGSASNPLRFQVGYYTEVAGLGATPRDVVINGAVEVYNQCDQNGCLALTNFWRSMSNLTINATGGDGCRPTASGTRCSRARRVRPRSRSRVSRTRRWPPRR